MQSCLVSSPNDPFRFASGGYDGIVRVWDVRSLKADVASLRVQPKNSRIAANGPEGDLNEAAKNANGKLLNGKGGGTKVLGVDWSENGVLVAGGEAGVEIWKMS